MKKFVFTAAVLFVALVIWSTASNTAASCCGLPPPEPTPGVR